MKGSTLLKTLAAASVLGLGALAAQPALAQEGKTVKIAKGQPIVVGTSHVLSGADTALGLDVLRGIKIAVDDQGGKLMGHPIKLLEEDDGCSAEGGQTAATKIASNQQTVVVLGSACSSACRVMAPILWKAGIPQIGTACSSPVLTAPDRDKASYDGFVRMVYNDLWAGREVANWAIKTLGYKRFATIHDGSAYAEKLVRVFQENVKKGGGEIVSDEAVAPTDTDMRPVLTKIATSNPEMIYSPTFVGVTSYLVRQKKEIKGLEKVRLIGSDAALGSQLLEAAGKDVIGFEITSTALEPEFQGPGYGKMKAKYLKMFGENPIQGFHGTGYDGYMVFAEAFKKVAKQEGGNTTVNTKALRDAIYATKNLNGVTGTITCDQYGDCGVYKFTVYAFTNQDPKSIDIGKNPKRVYPLK